MHPDLKHFYECTMDLAKFQDEHRRMHAYAQSYKHMLDTHPNCEELLDTFAELAIDIYNGDTAARKIQQMTEIEKELESQRLPF